MEDFDELTARFLVGRRICTVEDSRTRRKGASARVMAIDRFEDQPEKWGVAICWEPIEWPARFDWFRKHDFERHFGPTDAWVLTGSSGTDSH